MYLHPVTSAKTQAKWEIKEMAKRISISKTSAAASLTGLGSNVTGAAFTLTANDAGDALAHLITARNDSATDHSGKTIALVGTGPNGEPQTETLTAPGTSATVTSTKYFLTLTSATPSATIGADTFDIGWAAASVSAWFPHNTALPAFQVGIGCDVTSGSPTYTVQHTFGGAAHNDATLAAKTATAYALLEVPALASRLTFSAAGGVDFNSIQAGA